MTLHKFCSITSPGNTPAMHCALLSQSQRHVGIVAVTHAGDLVTWFSTGTSTLSVVSSTVDAELTIAGGVGEDALQHVDTHPAAAAEQLAPRHHGAAQPNVQPSPARHGKVCKTGAPHFYLLPAVSKYTPART